MDALLSSLTIRWQLLGEFLQAHWASLIDIVGDDTRQLWILGSCIISFSVYWLYAAIFTVMDYTERPKFLRKYKIQPGQNEPVELSRLWKAMKVVLFNLTAVNLIFSWLMFEISYKFQNVTNVRILPSFNRALFDVAVFLVLEEILFYYAHRMLHHKSIYKYIHKKHHEWTSPIAAVTLYAHPVEHVMGNLFPVCASLALLGSHISVAWTVFALAIINSMSDHAGYCFPWSAASVRFHDYHHEKFNYNYGVMGWLDKLHGTYRAPHKATAAVALKQKQNSLARKKTK